MRGQRGGFVQLSLLLRGIVECRYERESNFATKVLIKQLAQMANLRYFNYLLMVPDKP